MMQTRASNADFVCRDAADAKRIEGYFAVFGSNYEMFPGATESIDPHAFDETIGDDIRCLIEHDSRLVLGRSTAGTLQLRIDEKGLWGSVLINEHDQDAMNLYARVMRGDVSQCSIGFNILDEDETIKPDGTVHWTLRRVQLFDVSCVTFPAYKETGISARMADYKAAKKRQLDAEKARLRERVKEAWH